MYFTCHYDASKFACYLGWSQENRWGKSRFQLWVIFRNLWKISYQWIWNHRWCYKRHDRVGYLSITFHHWSFLSTKCHGVISGREKYNSDFIERNLNVRSFWYIYDLLQFFLWYYLLSFEHFIIINQCFSTISDKTGVLILREMWEFLILIT